MFNYIKNTAKSHVKNMQLSGNTTKYTLKYQVHLTQLWPKYISKLCSKGKQGNKTTKAHNYKRLLQM